MVSLTDGMKLSATLITVMVIVAVGAIILANIKDNETTTTSSLKSNETFNGSTQRWTSLTYSSLQANTEVVGTSKNGTLTRNTDYTVDLAQGQIRLNTTFAFYNETFINISYNWSQKTYNLAANTSNNMLTAFIDMSTLFSPLALVVIVIVIIAALFGMFKFMGGRM